MRPRVGPKVPQVTSLTTDAVVRNFSLGCRALPVPHRTHGQSSYFASKRGTWSTVRTEFGTGRLSGLRPLPFSVTWNQSHNYKADKCIRPELPRYISVEHRLDIRTLGAPTKRPRHVIMWSERVTPNTVIFSTWPPQNKSKFRRSQRAGSGSHWNKFQTREGSIRIGKWRILCQSSSCSRNPSLALHGEV